ncbi:UDP-N-acetylmuramate--L-alanine ligase [Mesonia aquimarina]|uniref:UDP-N-acetylmuramate--L-alanine ligase n=1 Tax=Mesonia aquimarina TaxID=1504967 RepID=UPI000EF5B7AD|nr:Mur ligase family protein [Mesonia aquimarina]
MKIHFIAIGGSAMHNLALALNKKGDQVSGSDDSIFEPSKTRLEKADLLPEEEGWFPEKITKDLDAIILGMHAKEDNPELKKAKELGIKIYSYPEFLYEHSKEKTRVVISGSHGKTTITAMILHVLHYFDKPTDFMVGAQLEGFDTMVHLTDENDFMLLEGDEYLSSAIDRRPKFHLYKPNIALISGIAWDHINVFPNFKNYVDQFKIFTEEMVNGSILVYNEEDPLVKEIAESATKPTRKHAYKTPNYTIKDGDTYIETPEGEMPVEIFGEHNLNNLAGAKWVCQHMGVDEADFYEAIATFKGAAKRLEKIAEKRGTVVFKDYAHSPSKVKATTTAVKNQFTDKERIVACLELHTYSSLTKEFLAQYKNTLDAADEAIVFYSPEAVQLKQLETLSPEEIQEAFQHKNLKVYVNSELFQAYLKEDTFRNAVVLFMSSGNYGGLDFDKVKDWL